MRLGLWPSHQSLSEIMTYSDKYDYKTQSKSVKSNRDYGTYIDMYMLPHRVHSTHRYTLVLSILNTTSDIFFYLTCNVYAIAALFEAINIISV